MQTALILWRWEKEESAAARLKPSKTLVLDQDAYLSLGTLVIAIHFGQILRIQPNIYTPSVKKIYFNILFLLLFIFDVQNLGANAQV